jgi:hypothetical protein
VSAELIAIMITSFIELAELTFVAWMAYRMSSKIAADDAAIYLKMASDDAALLLQGRRIEDVVKEMRDSLRSA